jgi:maltooligosyltrehalose synthase
VTGRTIPDSDAWGDTRILAENLPHARFTDLFTGRTTVADPPSHAMNVSELLADFPVALLAPAD